MTPAVDPTYVYDFSDSLNCATTESAKPGQSVRVRVRPEGDASGASLVGSGTRSDDGADFAVRVDTPTGKQSFSWQWTVLMDAIAAHRRQG